MVFNLRLIWVFTFSLTLLSCGKGDGDLNAGNGGGRFFLGSGTDPLLQHAWHITNTGQNAFASNPGKVGADVNMAQTMARNISGKGVRIAISDSGVQIDHEDLWSNHLAGESRDYTSANPDDWYGQTPSSPFAGSSSAHGTLVAGLAVASADNGVGSRGIASESNYAGFLFVGTSITGAKYFDQAQGNFDIFNYSYGIPSCVYQESIFGYLDLLMEQYKNGRNGKGTIYVKAAGNDYYAQASVCENPNATYLGNANFDQDNTTPATVLVAALDASGNAAFYSTPGANIWISSPGGDFGMTFPALISTDLQGCEFGVATADAVVNEFDRGNHDLNKNCNYSAGMNGTSGSAPIASGAIALLLEVQPQLSARDVKYILAKSAEKVNASSGSNSHPQGLDLENHTFEPGWTTNAAGFHFHNWYGFGALDIDAAVALAEEYHFPLGPPQVVTQTRNNLNKTIPDNAAAGVIDTITIADELLVESAVVEISVDHEYIGEIGIELTSPQGTRSVLMYINSQVQDNQLVSTRLLSNAFYGENTKGGWTIKVIDGGSGDTGVLKDWKLTLHSHQSKAQL